MAPPESGRTRAIVNTYRPTCFRSLDLSITVPGRSTSCRFHLTRRATPAPTGAGMTARRRDWWLRSACWSSLFGSEGAAFWDRIVEATSIGERDVYVVSVAGTHNIVAQGVSVQAELEHSPSS
jgi:hypothetical protein